MDMCGDENETPISTDWSTKDQTVSSSVVPQFQTNSQLLHADFNIKFSLSLGQCPQRDIFVPHLPLLNAGGVTSPAFAHLTNRNRVESVIMTRL